MTENRWLIGVALALCSAVSGAAGFYAAQPAELIWCCDAEGNCTSVETLSECGPGSLLFVCEWGWSTEQSREGASGWECLEQ